MQNEQEVLLERSIHAKPGEQRRSDKNEWLPYRGPPGMVIAIDLGTTFSGASYCILTPGKKPEIHDVKSFPGQVTSSSKVPSVVLFNKSSEIALFGAEAVNGSSANKILDQGGFIVRCWKLHMKPAHLKLIESDNDQNGIPSFEPLPKGIHAEEITAKFLAYMTSCVGSHIISRHSNGPALLQQFGSNIHYVITIPNGWELAQQQVLRNACLSAGLVTPERAQSISFVTEAEASVNFCIHSSQSQSWIERVGQEFIVCDAGGGTIDISSYTVTAIKPTLNLAETSISDCLIAGSTTIDRRARDLIQARLKGSEWDNENDLNDLQLAFCTSIKETFSDKTEDQYLAIGRNGLNDEKLNIRRGKLIFTGEEVASIYEPSIRAAEKSIRKRLTKKESLINEGRPVPVAMVGGFSESIFFRTELQNRLANVAHICKPDEATSKAVANGAVAWLIDGVVSERVAKMTYGIRCSTRFKPSDKQHLARQSQAFISLDGSTRLSNSFGPILHKGESGVEDRDHIEPFTLTWQATAPMLRKDVALIVYRGDIEPLPEFVDQPGL